MKIHVISDLHLESSDLLLPITQADVTVFGGDIAPGMRGVEFAGHHMIKTGKPVIYVNGNHEFYHFDITGLRRKIRELTTQPEDFEGPKFHFLDNSEVVIDNVRFLGCTLWTNLLLFGWDKLEQCLLEGERCLNDFRLIRNGGELFTVHDSIRLNEESIKWLEKKLKREPFNGKTVVITHHAPSFGSVVPRYQKSLLSACFASHLDHLLGYSSLWVHGHMHDSLDYEVNNTRIICNPRGYTWYSGNENNDFNPALIIEI